MAPKYVITAYSRLLRYRVEISKPVLLEDAVKLLENYKRSSSLPHGRRLYIHPKIERKQPIQLTLKFENYE